MSKRYHIDSDIRKAHTLPGTFYTDPVSFEWCRESVFAASWQMIVGAEDHLKTPASVWPFLYMDTILEEPLMVLRNAENELNVLSNVCTHRGKILVENATQLDKGIVCGYHGRRFGLDGQFQSMPAATDMLNFPCAQDNLTKLPVYQWHQFIFTSLQPKVAPEQVFEPLNRKVGFMPVDQFKYTPAYSRDYLVQANWALYCDNYLEGFHIPFVHHSLAASLDWNAYRTEIYPYANCQVGVSRGGEHVFALPKDHEDYGQSIAAYYYWVFPNMMFNFYPWGLSVNIVRPVRHDLTKVSFRTYVWDESKRDKGAGADLDRVEREDEAVVEQVQKGTKSRFYKDGRFSPTREQGVHHFHQIVADWIG